MATECSSIKDTTSAVYLKEEQLMMNTYDNLFKSKEKDSKSHGIVISGHRGGQDFKEPENTMHAFEKAVKQRLKSIELDVWLTKDDQFVVIHGGIDGQMPEPIIDDNGVSVGITHGNGPKYIFEHTFEEVQNNHRKTKYFLKSPSKRDEKSLLPLLKDVFALVADKERNP